MKVPVVGASGLSGYVAAQLATFFPDGRNDSKHVIDRNLDESIERVRRCINAVRIWPKDEFDYLHTEQNTIFLYFLANTIWRNGDEPRVATKIYYLNKALNSFNCYYEVALPDIFFVGHSVGIVLSRATYADYFAVYQNSTVGWNNGVGPTFEEGVVLFPNSFVLGRCRLRRGSIVAQGTSLIDRDTEQDRIAYLEQGELRFRDRKRDILGAIFRLEERQ